PLKKLYSEPEAQDRTRRRQRYEEEERRRHKERARSRRKAQEGLPRLRRLPTKEFELTGPANFSMINNPDGFIDFMNSLRRQLGRRRKVFVNLSAITDLTPDALAVLLASISVWRRHDVSGNLPSDLRLSSMVKESGFLQHVTSNVPSDWKSHGTIMKGTGLRVEPERADDLVARTT